MSKILTLSGWGQAHDSLSNVTPDGTIHADYSHYKNSGEFFQTLKDINPDIVIGWSLGGQLALRAISDGMISPKHLVLIATPYQFVASKDIKCAMNIDNFNAFYSSFENDPVRTLKRFFTLISLNDSNAHDILTTLKTQSSTEHVSRWLYWLDELEKFSCNLIDFSKIPATISIHGADDTIVDHTQNGLFMPLIANYTLETFEKCGHAPHLHDSERVSEIIKKLL